MPFPAAALRPRVCDIEGFLFENASAGIPLDLFWCFTVEFERLEYAEATFDCQLAADFVRLDIRDWRNLAGIVIEGGRADINASFYTTEHDPAVWTAIRIGARDGSTFRLDWEAAIDFGGWTGDDVDPRLAVSVHAVAAFSGVFVPEDVGGRAEVERLLSQFLDRQAFGPLVQETNRFGVRMWRLLP